MGASVGIPIICNNTFTRKRLIKRLKRRTDNYLTDLLVLLEKELLHRDIVHYSTFFIKYQQQNETKKI